ncbi:MAG: efflux RND transporter periplasmic adaptor subunit [Bryobacteraceae bacterium]|nr:efflux RND transporter periplasmic adaptor subunit [Bryobacterales bacterium]MEB2361193.1 efflux RND transporter periplasmic adaptor subunit [Bryobacterales bacterium]NUN00351.1 efflux RND transporter periplasmic adaptor subunit [Bryobacteraceae bacterium]
MKVLRAGLAVLCALALRAQAVDTVKVASGGIERTVVLPGEFQPFQAVDLHARVTGFVESVKVDRGSMVRRGDLLMTLSAPEMVAQLAEAQSKAHAAAAGKAEAEARLAGIAARHERLKKASETPGAVAGIEIIESGKEMEAAKAAASAAEKSAEAAQASLDVLKQLESYLHVIAPFDGTITGRYVHPGALVGPDSNSGPLLRLEQLSRLRLVVSVPELDVGGIVPRARVPFTVPAYPGQQFSGIVARIARSMDVKTRSMPVELDVMNPTVRLSPGMYPQVEWPVRSGRNSLLVPLSSIASTTARSFVIRVRNGRAEWVDVRTGVRSGDRVEVFGKLSAGDEIVLRASDEIREGAELDSRIAERP